MRGDFEKLPSISVFLPSFKFNEATNEYERSENFNQPEYTLGFFNGAWYTFQHQQTKVDELNQELEAQREETIKGYSKISELRLECDELRKRVEDLELNIKGAVTFVDLQIEATEQGREAAIGTQARNWWSSKLLMLRPIRRVLEQALKGGEG